MKKANITVDEVKWDNFLYVLKVLTKKQGGSKKIREWMDEFLEENKDIVDSRNSINAHKLR